MADDELIEIRIPMIVTADGKWAASASSGANGEPDWPWLEEMIDYEKPPVCPQRYWITAYVRKPKVGEIPGAAMRDGAVQTDAGRTPQVPEVAND